MVNRGRSVSGHFSMLFAEQMISWGQKRAHYAVTTFSRAVQKVGLLPALVFEHSCAHARWAHMHRFVSVSLSVRDLTKIQTR